MTYESNHQQCKKFCTQCGNELLPGVKFCSNCGTLINLPNSYKYPSSNQFPHHSIPKAKMHTITKATLILVVLCLICLFSIFLQSPFILHPLCVLTFYIAVITIIVLNIVPRKSHGDSEHGGLNILSFLFPLIGFIFYFVWHDEKPRKSKGIIRNAILGMLLNIVLCIILMNVL